MIGVPSVTVELVKNPRGKFPVQRDVIVHDHTHISCAFMP